MNFNPSIWAVSIALVSASASASSNQVIHLSGDHLNSIVISNEMDVVVKCDAEQPRIEINASDAVMPHMHTQVTQTAIDIVNNEGFFSFLKSSPEVTIYVRDHSVQHLDVQNGAYLTADHCVFNNTEQLSIAGENGAHLEVETNSPLVNLVLNSGGSAQICGETTIHGQLVSGSFLKTGEHVHISAVSTFFGSSLGKTGDCS